MSTNTNLNNSFKKEKQKFAFAMTAMVFMSYLFFLTQLLLGLVITMITRTIILLKCKRMRSKMG